jgi:hypothetical protein
MLTDRQMGKRTDRQSEIAKLIVACRNFADDPINYEETGEQE